MRLTHCLLSLLAVPAVVAAQTAWTRVPLFPGRHGHATAYDAARGRIVLFGGRFPLNAETWEWDGTVWTQRTPAMSPPARQRHAMAFDSARGRVVLFGGEAPSFGSNMADTWEWDGSNWSRAATPVAPPASAGHGLAYDPGRRRMVLYGGSVPRGNTWEWDGTLWTSATQPQAPPQGSGQQLVYDASRARVLFVGGTSVLGSTMETWEWSSVGWSPAAAGWPRPPWRDYHALAYDTVRQRVVLFGGYDWRGGRFVVLDDLWELSAAAGWNQVLPAGSTPSARCASRLDFDPVRRRVVLSGGADWYDSFSDTWEWDGAAWQLRAGPDAPPPGSFAMAFDARRARTVLHIGGSPPPLGVPGNPPATWEFDGLRWRPVATGGPFERLAFALAYDPSRGKVVLFGGFAAIGSFRLPLGDTFEWDGSTWTAVAGSAPPSRALAAMAFDRHRQRLLLHGGLGDTGPRNDTWEWGATGWQPRNPVHTPPARERAGMVFDEARGRMVLFLADNTSSAAAETWEWDGTDWIQRQPRTTPPPRSGFGLVYDDRRARVVLFGGTHTASSVAFQDTWEWDGTEWQQRSVPVAPAPRSTSMAYDGQRGRVVLFGGGDAFTVFGDTWEYAPVHPASYQEFGAGCAGSAGVPRLRAMNLPWLGDRFSLRAERLPPGNSALVWLGASRSQWGTLPLPLDLTAAGMPGCFLHVRPTLMLPLFNLGGTADVSVAVPNDPVLLGQGFYGQALVVDRAANPFGAATSNGGDARLGAR